MPFNALHMKLCFSICAHVSYPGQDTPKEGTEQQPRQRGISLTNEGIYFVWNLIAVLQNNENKIVFTLSPIIFLTVQFFHFVKFMIYIKYIVQWKGFFHGQSKNKIFLILLNSQALITAHAWSIHPNISSVNIKNCWLQLWSSYSNIKKVNHLYT